MRTHPGHGPSGVRWTCRRVKGARGCTAFERCVAAVADVRRGHDDRARKPVFGCAQEETDRARAARLSTRSDQGHVG